MPLWISALHMFLFVIVDFVILKVKLFSQLSRLSVFAGGMEFEAVGAVCAGDDIDPYDLLDFLSELVNKSLVIARRDQNGIARCLLLLGHYRSDRFENYRAQLLESLTIFRNLDDKLGCADALRFIGYYEGPNNYDKAIEYLEESELLYRELGHVSGIAEALRYAGLLAIWKENYDFAREKLEEILKLEELLEYWGTNPFILLGLLHFRQGDYQQAQRYLEKALVILRQVGNKWYEEWALIHLGYVFLRSGDLPQAHKIL